MTINEYTTSVVGLIVARLCLYNSDRSDSARHLRYLYKQALYGYEEFGSIYASRLAQWEYERMGNSGQIVQWRMHQYRKFDKLGRQKGSLHLDHVYTLAMFDRALRALPEDGINENSINEIVNANYAVAWLTKEEDSALTRSGYKSKRGVCLADALQVYKNHGISLIPTTK